MFFIFKIGKRGYLMFEVEHKKFVEDHVRRRQGKRLFHLKEGHAHAEVMFLKNIWWPLFQNFDGLHPQYEVHDFKDGSRYLDFAYLTRMAKVCIEIDGRGTHSEKSGDDRFSDDRVRQNDLVLDDWMVIRFSYKHILQRPRDVQKTILHMMGKVSGGERQGELSIVEREVLRFGIWHNGEIGVKKLREHLQMSGQFVKKTLDSLRRKGLIVAIGGPHRIHKYRLVYEKVRPYHF